MNLKDFCQKQHCIMGCSAETEWNSGKAERLAGAGTKGPSLQPVCHDGGPCFTAMLQIPCHQSK